MNRILLLTTIIVISLSLPPECYNTLVQSQSCSWYPLCLQQKFKCGKGGYPMDYGYKYCTKFGNLKTFPAARLWIQKTTTCLKASLLPQLNENVQKSCKELKKEAFQTHPKCYVDSGFCQLYHQLGLEDSAIFLKQLLSIFEAKDFESILAVKQIEDVVKDCWVGTQK